MAKKDKAVEEEIPIEEASAVIQEIVAAQVQETPEQRDARLLRKRKEEALVERKDIIERNGGRFEDHTSADGVEIVAQCCGK